MVRKQAKILKKKRNLRWFAKQAERIDKRREICDDAQNKRKE